MHGTTHSVCGAIAGTLVGACTRDPAMVVSGLAFGTVAALGPDIDHPNSTAGKALPPVRWILNFLSFCCGLPSHRGLTHTVLFAVLVGGGTAWGLHALTVPIDTAVWLGGATTAGWLAALAGDAVTKTGLPHLWWPFAEPSSIGHKQLRITTGKGVEKYIVYPLVSGLLLVELWWVFTSLAGAAG